MKYKLTERMIDRLELNLDRKPTYCVAPNGPMTEARYWLDVVLPYFAPGLLLNSPKARSVLGEASTEDYICGFSNRMWLFSDGSYLIATQEGQKLSP